MNRLWGWMAAFSAVAALEAQVQIVPSCDFFGTPGESYRAYRNSAPVDVSNRIGEPGGPQVWDFTTGPTDEIVRFDYVEAAGTEHAGTFPGAVVAERLTVENTGKEAWLFFTMSCEAGRRTHGYVDPEQTEFPEGLLEISPEGVFASPITDFPRTIGYGDSWGVGTQWFSTIGFAGFEFPMRTEYSAESKVDAYGLLRQPGLGFDECLRVNEVARYVVSIKFAETEDFSALTDQQVRSYYWLRPGHGIAVQITSEPTDSIAPPETFTTASSFVRQFELDHAPCEQGPQAVADLEITKGARTVLLNWSAPCFSGRFRLETTTDLSRPDSWTEVVTTTQNFHLEDTAGETGARYYRVVSLP